MKTTTLILLLAVVLSACAPAVTPIPPTATPLPPTAGPKALAAEIDAIVQENNRAGVFDGAISGRPKRPGDSQPGLWLRRPF